MRARATEFVPRMVSPVVAQASSGPRPGVQSFQLLRPLYQAQTSPPQPVRGPDFRDSVLVEPLQPQQIYANMLLSSYAPATRCAIVDTSKKPTEHGPMLSSSSPSRSYARVVVPQSCVATTAPLSTAPLSHSAFVNQSVSQAAASQRASY